MFVAEFQYAWFIHTYIFYLLKQEKIKKLMQACQIEK